MIGCCYCVLLEQLIKFCKKHFRKKKLRIFFLPHFFFYTCSLKLKKLLFPNITKQQLSSLLLHSSNISIYLFIYLIFLWTVRGRGDGCVREEFLIYFWLWKSEGNDAEGFFLKISLQVSFLF